MDEESATTVALPFLLRGRWRNTAMHSARLYGTWFLYKNFFSAQCSGRLEKKKISCSKCLEGLGALGDRDNFYMGMQNRSKYEI